MSRIFLFLIFFMSINSLKSQIIVDNGAPYDNPIYLIDNILLGGGVVATNHSYQGDTRQIGYLMKMRKEKNNGIWPWGL